MNSEENIKESISDIEISEDREKINRIRDIIDEHEGIIEQVDILKNYFDGQIFMDKSSENSVKSALSKIESDMNKMTLGRITEVVEEEVC